MAITSTNLPVTTVDSSMAHGVTRNQPYGLGIRVWRTANTHCLHQSANDHGRIRRVQRPLPNPDATMAA